MLIDKIYVDFKIDFSEIKADEYIRSVQCKANYNFSKTNRKVINKIMFYFSFKMA